VGGSLSVWNSLVVDIVEVISADRGPLTTNVEDGELAERL